MFLVIGLLLGIIAGGVAAYFIQNSLLTKKKEQIIHEAEVEAEAIKKEKTLQAKENFLKLKEEHENSVKEKDRKLQSLEDKVKSKENTLSQKIEEISRHDAENVDRHRYGI